MGSCNSGSNGGSKRKQLNRGRRRDDLPSVGIAARRASSRCGASRHCKNGPNSGRRTLSNMMINKYANRRTSFFKSVRPLKAPDHKAGIRTNDALWDRCGRLFRAGDIVSITDKEDGLPYFAQIRALLSNQLGDRFAALTWLVPAKSAEEAHHFVAEQFVHALSDSVLCPLEVCTFMQHAPVHPNYRRGWNFRSITEKKLREEMDRRVRSVNATSTKLIAFDENVLFKKQSQDVM